MSQRQHSVNPFRDPTCKVLWTSPRSDGGVVYVMSRRPYREVLQSYADSISVPLNRQSMIAPKAADPLTDCKQ